jgi:hypothetical protein
VFGLLCPASLFAFSVLAGSDMVHSSLGRYLSVFSKTTMLVITASNVTHQRVANDQ